MAWSQNLPSGNQRTLSRELHTNQISPPDMASSMEQETEEVCRNYFYQSYENDINHGELQDLPVFRELVQMSDPPTAAADLGRQLARFGDDINKRYADIFDSMISQLQVDPADAYEDFANIGRRLFANGRSWSSIIILLSFGYRMAVTVLRSKTSEFFTFLKRIVSFICRFLITERIAKWIADHGGWRGALSYIPRMASRHFWFVTALQLTFIIVLVLRHR